MSRRVRVVRRSWPSGRGGKRFKLADLEETPLEEWFGRAAEKSVSSS